MRTSVVPVASIAALVLLTIVASPSSAQEHAGSLPETEAKPSLVLLQAVAHKKPDGSLFDEPLRVDAAGFFVSDDRHILTTVNLIAPFDQSYDEDSFRICALTFPPGQGGSAQHAHRSFAEPIGLSSSSEMLLLQLVTLDGEDPCDDNGVGSVEKSTPLGILERDPRSEETVEVPVFVRLDGEDTYRTPTRSGRFEWRYIPTRRAAVTLNPWDSEGEMIVPLAGAPVLENGEVLGILRSPLPSTPEAWRVIRAFEIRRFLTERRFVEIRDAIGARIEKVEKRIEEAARRLRWSPVTLQEGCVLAFWYERVDRGPAEINALRVQVEWNWAADSQMVEVVEKEFVLNPDTYRAELEIRPGESAHFTIRERRLHPGDEPFGHEFTLALDPPEFQDQAQRSAEALFPTNAEFRPAGLPSVTIIPYKLVPNGNGKYAIEHEWGKVPLRYGAGYESDFNEVTEELGDVLSRCS